VRPLWVRKPDSEFAWRRRDRGQRDNMCRPCRAAYKREHYLAHKDRYKAKSFNISHALPYRGWQSILDEIEKCEVVCANCHRRRTATRNGHMRLLLNADASEGL
jgi:hypothetical protein